MIIIMKKYTNQKDDERISRLISSTKMKAPENLKHRIMHQIEYESALSPKKNVRDKSANRDNATILRELGSIFGTMYAVMAIIAIIAYFIEGSKFYQSIEFWGTITLVALIFSFFWLFSRIDTHIKEKQERKIVNDVLSKSDKRE